MSAVKARQSNLELLRLIAMFGVLVVHTDFGALGFPDRTELISTPAYSVTRIIIEFFSIVAVNVFVLISGWFGITFRWKGLSNLLFQCLFFFFGIYTFCVIAGIKPLNLNGIYMCLMFSGNGWFIKSYLGMYILAPIMNAFVEHANRKHFLQLLICFFIFQSLYGWFSQGAAFIEEGYSAFSFMGLYLLARYVRVYQPRFSMRKRSYDFSAYACLSLASSAVFILASYLDKPAFTAMMFRYTNPLTIAAALFLLLAFSKIRLTSKAVNSVAASCFAVYLMHFILFPTFMRKWIIEISDSYGGITQLAALFLLLAGFFAAAIAIDRIRLLIWNKFISAYFDK